MKLSELEQEFRFHCAVERNFSNNTVISYKQDVEKFIDFSGDLSFEEALRKIILQNYLDFMLNEQGLSIATVRRRVSSLRSFSRFASERYGLVSGFKNWSPSIKRPKRLPRPLSRRELQALLHKEPKKSTDDETLFAVLFISATGVRVSEFCGVNVSDVAADGSSVFIQGKGSRERIVYVGNMMLRDKLISLRLERLSNTSPHGPMFLNLRGRRLQPQTLRRRLHSLSDCSKLQRRITPHMLRHTAATLLIENGIDIRLVQRLLGHASIATTEIYTQVSDRFLKQAIFDADILNEFVATNSHSAFWNWADS